LIEDAAFNRDLSIAARGKLEADASPRDSDELDATQPSVRRSSNPLRHLQSPQERPAGWVQAIAANLLAREFLAFHDHGSQTSSRAKGRAARPGRAAAHNRDIEHALLSWRAGCASRSGDFQSPLIWVGGFKPPLLEAFHDSAQQ
jgi:hypothetical protein